MPKASYIFGAAIAVALVASYTIVTVTGNDATGLLGALVGWLGGLAVPAGSAAVAKVNGNGGD